MKVNCIICADVMDGIKALPSKSVHCVVTSPPYWGLRDYGVPGQIGLEKTPEEYVARMMAVFREARRVLRDDGTLWLNIGDSYAGSGKGPSNSLHPEASCIGSKRGMNPLDGTPTERLPVPTGMKSKDLVGIPWMLAFALRADGWYLRSDIIWHKPNPMPESVTDRPTKAHEYIFLLSKSASYYYDAEAVREGVVPGTLTDRVDTGRFSPERGFPGARDHGNGRLGDNPGGLRNRRTVWTIATAPFKGAHFATFPPKLIEPCILAGCPAGGIVLDPFMGAGTTAVVAKANGRHWIGIELNPKYIEMAERRIAETDYQIPLELEA